MISDVLRARNAVLHTESGGIGEARVIELYWLSERLLFLVKACLLGELGIPTERQVGFLQRSRNYIHLRSQR